MSKVTGTFAALKTSTTLSINGENFTCNLWANTDSRNEGDRFLFSCFRRMRLSGCPESPSRKCILLELAKNLDHHLYIYTFKNDIKFLLRFRIENCYIFYSQVIGCTRTFSTSFKCKIKFVFFFWRRLMLSVFESIKYLVKTIYDSVII